MVLEEEGDACGDEQAAEEEVELEHRLEPEEGLVHHAHAQVGAEELEDVRVRVR